jgi:hypothetical protein
LLLLSPAFNMTSLARPHTPPHHPIYGVSLSTNYIERLIAVVFSHYKLSSISTLPSGRSFNNRIYFVTVRPLRRTLASDPGPSESPPLRERPEDQELVLKVNCRFFGTEKIQNGVSCLKLAEIYCLSVHTPKAIAWSEDGNTIHLSNTSPTAVLNCEAVGIGLNSEGEAIHHPGWILMTRLPGETLSAVELIAKQMASVGAQLAEMIASMRSSIPATHLCGNLLLHQPRFSADEPDIEVVFEQGGIDSSGGGTGMMIRGLLGDGILSSEPIATELELHTTRLRAKLNLLETEEVYARQTEYWPP